MLLDGSEYKVLLHLSEAKDRRMRMSELAAAAALSDSAMTRIVDRLAGDGLVERVRFDRDTRVVLAVLTRCRAAPAEARVPHAPGGRPAIRHSRRVRARVTPQSAVCAA